MELSFELLREAGVRLPGAMGNTIGIVGGLIIGQAAVDANIVSPMVVIVVAFTALCSFAIPNEDFATAFRLLKFVFIGLSAALGFYGFLLGLQQRKEVTWLAEAAYENLSSPDITQAGS